MWRWWEISFPDFDLDVIYDAYARTNKFTIFKRKNKVVAMDNDGLIRFVDDDFATILQLAINNLTLGRNIKESICVIGDFTVSKTIELDDYMKLIIKGKLKLEDNVDAPMFYANGKSNIEIIGGELDGNGANQTGGGLTRYELALIRFLNVSDVLLKDIYIHDAISEGVLIYPFEWDKNFNIIVDGLKVKRTGGFVSGIDGDHVQFGGCVHLIVKNCIFEKPCSDTSVSINYSRKVLVSNNIINNDGPQAITIAFGSHDVKVSDNIFDTKSAVKIWDDGIQEYNIEIVNNEGIIDDTFTHAYDGPKNVIISDNLVNWDSGWFAFFEEGGENIIINSNVAQRYGPSAAFIELRGVKYSIISNNKFDGIGHGTGAIYLRDYGSNICEYIKIHHNILRNALDEGISLEGGTNNVEVYRNTILNITTPIRDISTGINKIWGNKGYKTENSGVATISAGSTSVEVSHELVSTPSKIVLTPRGNVGAIWVSSRDSSKFTIMCETAPSSDVQVDWMAEV